MILHWQQGGKAEASRAPKSALQPATSQPALAVVGTEFLESFYTAGCAALPSVAAAFGCARSRHSLSLSLPCRTCHCSICAQLPPLALLLLLILCFSAWGTVEEPALPSACPGSQAGSAARPPSGASTAALPALPCPRAWLQCHLPSATLLVPSFSEAFGPQRDNLVKDKVVGASRACPACLVHAGACSFLWAFDTGPLLALSAFYQEHLFEDKAAEAVME